MSYEHQRDFDRASGADEEEREARAGFVTAKTITDEQIRELRDWLTKVDWTDRIGPRTRKRISICNAALAGANATATLAAIARRHARIRCAEIWNARQEGK